MTLKSLFLTCIFFILSQAALWAQETQLTGEDICSDGTQLTEIGLDKADSNSYYVLFRDGQQIVKPRQNINSDIHSFLFGSFSKPGIYTASRYATNDSVVDYKMGQQIDGQVIIEKRPVVTIKEDSIVISSGELFLFKPEINRSDVQILWTSTLINGKLKRMYKKGRGPLALTFELVGKKPATLIFSFEPNTSSDAGGCKGNKEKLKVVVVPNK